jgi:hypothetical protein
MTWRMATACRSARACAGCAPFGFRDLGAGVGEHVELAAAGADFLEVALELFEQLVGRGHGDDGHVLVDQGQRAVLELAGGVASAWM